MSIPVNAISKVSQFAAATTVADSDLLFLSQDQGGGSYISKKVTIGNMAAHLDDRYIRRVDVFLSAPLGVLIIDN